MSSIVEGETPKRDGLLATPIIPRRPSPGIMSKDRSSNNVMPSASFGENSTYATSFVGESSNALVGPGGILTPRNSILMNPSNKKTFVDAWRPKDGGGPAVLHIPAPQSAKDRELEREREKMEREKEIERELKEMEQAEKVWGIPKKAFYMGLGDINFNAQMAMLGGWGNGSGPATDFRPNMLAPLPRKLSGVKKKSSKGSKGSKRSKSKPNKDRFTDQMKKPSSETPAIKSDKEGVEKAKGQKERGKDEPEESDDSMDPEELAALNAIINTRRSMEAAQALANRSNSKISQTKRNNSTRVSTEVITPSEKRDGIRDEKRQETPDTTGLLGLISSQNGKNGEAIAGTNSPLTFANRHGSDLQKREHSHIRFAPLPQAYGTPSPALNVLDGVNPFDEVNMSGEYANNDRSFNSNAMGSDVSGEEDSDEEDENRSRRLGSRSRWYLMGMPKSVFKSQNNRSTRRPSSISGGLDPSASRESLSRSPGSEQILSNGAASTPPASTSTEQRRGRRTRLRRSASAAGSIKSRSSSVGSIDDEDRRRRREMIRASRPGGTGMVTLPDGTRIRARRVGEEGITDDEEFNEWGFAGLSRRSMGDAERPSIEAITGDKRASDDDRVSDKGEDSGSGMSWVKRRRRERERERERQSRDISPGSNVDEGNTNKNATATDEEVERRSMGEDVEEGREAKISNKKITDNPMRPSISPVAPIATPTLSASRAAEVRRRHEQEVASLGAEVLESIAKAKKAKLREQQQGQHLPPLRSMTLDPNLTQPIEKIDSNIAASPILGNTGTGRGKPNRTASLDAYGSHVPALMAKQGLHHHGTSSKRSSSQIGFSPVHATTHTRHWQNPNQNAGETSDGIKTPTGMETPTPTRKRYQSPSRLTSSPPPVVLESPGVLESELDRALTNFSHETTKEPAVIEEVEEEKEIPSSPKETLARTSMEGKLSPSVSSHDSHFGFSQSPGRETASSLYSKSSRGRLRGAALPIPSPDLPRRPDGRGYSIVPLPIHQLGRRPQRPTEGRVWQFDDLDDSSDEEDRRDQDEDNSGDDDEEGNDDENNDTDERRRRQKRLEEEDEEESMMNAEELAEEERRTAIQKKRATTRAAGAELVSSMAKSRAAKKNGSGSKAIAPYEKRNLNLSASPTASSGRRASSTGIADPKNTRRDQMRRSHDGSPRVRSTMSSSALNKGKRSIRPVHSIQDNFDDLDDDDYYHDEGEQDGDDADDDENVLTDSSDDADLWPPTLSSTQLSRTLSIGETDHQAVAVRRASIPNTNFASGVAAAGAATAIPPSTSSSHNDKSGQGSKQAILLAAHSAKAKLIRDKKSKEAKERERLRILRLKENDEYLDYGWPRSLQGSSLYD